MKARRRTGALLALGALLLGGCTATTPPGPAPAPTTTFERTASTPQPTTAPDRPAPTTPVEQVHGPGLYRLHMATDRSLTCLVEEGPGEMIFCAADFPVTWKILYGDHAQAAQLIISSDEHGQLGVDASTRALITPAIAPVEIRDSALLAGVRVDLSEDEVLFSTAVPDSSAVLITPDSYEVLTVKVGQA